MNKLLSELKRRNIFRIAGVYAVVSWIIMQVISVMTPALKLPDWVDSFFAILLLAGFPIAVILAWAFEMTPEGVKRTEAVSTEDSITTKTGRKLDVAIMAGLAVVIAVIIGSFVLKPSGSDKPSQTADVEASDSSIAVLPFENFSTDKDQDYFASGISEELLNALAKIDGLRVSSRTSAFAFKGQEKPIAEIAEALNVAHVLEGSVRKSGNTLRITAQLIDTKTDVHMWSETYDRALTADNIFDIQDEITAAIVRELQGQMDFAVAQDETARTTSVEAYELYLRARNQAEHRTREPMLAAIEGYKQVIDLDPDFAPAYAGLAVTYLLMDEYGGMDSEEATGLVKPLVAKALELAPNSAEALVAAADLAFAEKDIPKSLEFSQNAITANPNYTLAYHRKGMVLGNSGQPEKALSAFQKALALDPLSAVLLTNAAIYQQQLGDIAGARQTALDNIRWNPESAFGYRNLAQINLEEGDFAAAHSYLKDSQARNSEQFSIRYQLLTLYLDIGLLDQARTIARTPYEKAMVHFSSGETEKAKVLYSEITNELEKLNMGYLLQDYAAIAAIIDKYQPLIIPKGIPLTKDGNLETAAYFTFGYAQTGHADTEEFTKLLDNYFKEKQPAEFSTQAELYAGAILQIIKGNPDAAIAWLEQGFELGSFSQAELLDPVFDSIREKPAFQAIVARTDKILAVQRADIQNQLANPEPDWIMTE